MREGCGEDEAAETPLRLALFQLWVGLGGEPLPPGGSAIPWDLELQSKNLMCLKGEGITVGVIHSFVVQITSWLIQLCSITSQPPTSTPATPGIGKSARPASARLLGNILGRSEACAICFVGVSTFIGAKISLDCSWSLNVIPPALESGVQSREEVIKVSSKDTAALLQSSCGATHYQGE